MNASELRNGTILKYTGTTKTFTGKEIRIVFAPDDRLFYYYKLVSGSIEEFYDGFFQDGSDFLNDCVLVSQPDTEAPAKAIKAKFKLLSIDTNLFTGEVKSEEALTGALKSMTIIGGNGVISILNNLKKDLSYKYRENVFTFSGKGQSLLEFLTTEN